MLHDSIFEKKEEHSLFILKQKIYLVPHLFNMDVHSYILQPMAIEQSQFHLHSSREVTTHID